MSSSQRQWGTVNLYGVGSPDNNGYYEDFGNGQKQGWSASRNQQLALPPDVFRMSKTNNRNNYSANGQMMSTHEAIKGMIGQGMTAQNAKRVRETSHPTKAEVYKHKYQSKGNISPFSSQEQESSY